MKSIYSYNYFYELLFIMGLFPFLISCNAPVVDSENEKAQIDSLLNKWHSAAAQANFEEYFNYFDEHAVFIGTDATENWNKSEFMIWAKPFFDRGKAWHFTSLERHVFIDSSGSIAWFDELLSTQMKLCRGSGVLQKRNEVWKIQHYVLSMTIPNAISDTVIELKTGIEESITDSLLKNDAIYFQ
ncbi:MAG: nuclear transport factor 2 family protein [Bacteroidales bacterium]|nr:nuclear transport factor 2 family protein [Bacteroidales bacterium]